MDERRRRPPIDEERVRLLSVDGFRATPCMPLTDDRRWVWLLLSSPLMSLAVDPRRLVFGVDCPVPYPDSDMLLLLVVVVGVVSLLLIWFVVVVISF